ncbi:MAG: ATP-dependent Clp protease ATP-binding subunit [Kiritimatiellae bacterium]|nr:ATP-dependent Clp protease ATP-binding subunit [Kiritimatiellia bacterium]
MANWDEQFVTQCRIRRAVILHGNVQDAFFDGNSLVGMSIVDLVINRLRALPGGQSYSNIVCWDKNSGARQFVGNAEEELRSSIASAVPQQSDSQAEGAAYDLEEDADLGKASAATETNMSSALKEAGAFFNVILSRLRGAATHPGRQPIAYIIDGADALFGNANQLSEAERVNLIQLGDALRDSPCTLNAADLDSPGDLVVFIASRLSSIPPRFYQDTSAICCINVPRPDRKDREAFLKKCTISLLLKEPMAPGTGDFEEMVDSLDGFTYRDMQQLVKLSRVQDPQEPLSFKRLIPLYKFGERKSPWEELNKDRIEKLEEELKARVKGQDHIIGHVANVIKRAYLGLSGLQHSSKQQMPKGIFFFVGPTGVGKTEMAKAIASFLFGEEEACIRFDMSEYAAEHSDQRLVGAPPGYVGYEAGGQLTNAVRDRPFSVLLFDEIEKSHPKIFDKFLQILEDGRLTDGKGDTVSFSETVIIFTSNIGAAEVLVDDPDPGAAFIQKVTERFRDEMKRPELLNRIGQKNILPFNYLTDKTVQLKIASLKVKPLVRKLKEKYDLTFEIPDEEQALQLLLDGFDAANGGRGVANRVDEMIIQPLTEELFSYDMEELRGRTMQATVKKTKASGRFAFKLV